MRITNGNNDNGNIFVSNRIITVFNNSSGKTCTINIRDVVTLIFKTLSDVNTYYYKEVVPKHKAIAIWDYQRILDEAIEDALNKKALDISGLKNLPDAELRAIKHEIVECIKDIRSKKIGDKPLDLYPIDIAQQYINRIFNVLKPYKEVRVVGAARGEKYSLIQDALGKLKELKAKFPVEEVEDPLIEAMREFGEARAAIESFPLDAEPAPMGEIPKEVKSPQGEAPKPTPPPAQPVDEPFTTPRIRFEEEKTPFSEVLLTNLTPYNKLSENVQRYISLEAYVEMSKFIFGVLLDPDLFISAGKKIRVTGTDHVGILDAVKSVYFRELEKVQNNVIKDFLGIKSVSNRFSNKMVDALIDNIRYQRGILALDEHEVIKNTIEEIRDNLLSTLNAYEPITVASAGEPFADEGVLQKGSAQKIAHGEEGPAAVFQAPPEEPKPAQVLPEDVPVDITSADPALASKLDSAQKRVKRLRSELEELKNIEAEKTKIVEEKAGKVNEARREFSKYKPGSLKKKTNIYQQFGSDRITAIIVQEEAQKKVRNKERELETALKNLDYVKAEISYAQELKAPKPVPGAVPPEEIKVEAPKPVPGTVLPEGIKVEAPEPTPPAPPAKVPPAMEPAPAGAAIKPPAEVPTAKGIAELPPPEGEKPMPKVPEYIEKPPLKEEPAVEKPQAKLPVEELPVILPTEKPAVELEAPRAIPENLRAQVTDITESINGALKNISNHKIYRALATLQNQKKSLADFAERFPELKPLSEKLNAICKGYQKLYPRFRKLRGELYSSYWLGIDHIDAFEEVKLPKTKEKGGPVERKFIERESEEIDKFKNLKQEFTEIQVGLKEITAGLLSFSETLPTVKAPPVEAPPVKAPPVKAPSAEAQPEKAPSEKAPPEKARPAKVTKISQPESKEIMEASAAAEKAEKAAREARAKADEAVKVANEADALAKETEERVNKKIKSEVEKAAEKLGLNRIRSAASDANEELKELEKLRNELKTAENNAVNAKRDLREVNARLKAAKEAEQAASAKEINVRLNAGSSDKAKIRASEAKSAAEKESADALQARDEAKNKFDKAEKIKMEADKRAKEFSPDKPINILIAELRAEAAEANETYDDIVKKLKELESNLNLQEKLAVASTSTTAAQKREAAGRMDKEALSKERIAIYMQEKVDSLREEALEKAKASKPGGETGGAEAAEAAAQKARETAAAAKAEAKSLASNAEKRKDAIRKEAVGKGLEVDRKLGLQALASNVNEARENFTKAVDLKNKAKAANKEFSEANKEYKNAIKNLKDAANDKIGEALDEIKKSKERLDKAKKNKETVNENLDKLRGEKTIDKLIAGLESKLEKAKEASDNAVKKANSEKKTLQEEAANKIAAVDEEVKAANEKAAQTQKVVEVTEAAVNSAKEKVEKVKSKLVEPAPAEKAPKAKSPVKTRRARSHRTRRARGQASRAVTSGVKPGKKAEKTASLEEKKRGVKRTKEIVEGVGKYVEGKGEKPVLKGKDKGKVKTGAAAEKARPVKAPPVKAPKRSMERSGRAAHFQPTPGMPYMNPMTGQMEVLERKPNGEWVRKEVPLEGASGRAARAKVRETGRKK